MDNIPAIYRKDMIPKGDSMTKYLLETHCHTQQTSSCAKVSAERVVDLYIKSGYTGIVITDHLNAHYYGIENEKWEDRINSFFKGYWAAKKAANGKIDILLGMELTFENSSNDYLIYGLTEELIYQYNNDAVDFRKMGLRRFREFANDHGLLIIQAHPFRNNMTIVRPDYLDGIEIFNGNPRHDSRNDIAALWAEKYNFIATGGSDFHQEPDLKQGGLLTEQPVRTIDDLVRTLRSGSYELYKPVLRGIFPADT